MLSLTKTSLLCGFWTKNDQKLYSGIVIHLTALWVIEKVEFIPEGILSLYHVFLFHKSGCSLGITSIPGDPKPSFQLWKRFLALKSPLN